MRLEKWYGDVVLDGQVRIFYRASLIWGPLHLGYAAEMTPDGRFTHRWQSEPLALPHGDGDDLIWPTSAKADASQASIVWTPRGNAPELVLWQDEAAALAVRWQPLVCSGEVRSPRWPQVGRGYVERLSLDVAPWALGLHLLRWGRFCGQRHSVVWIEWQGAHPRSWAMIDSVLVHEVTVHPQTVQTPCAVVTWAQPQTLIKETLSAGPLRHLLQRTTAMKKEGLWAFLHATQHKYHAPAIWHGADGEVEHGHVVYEEVLWH